MAKKSATKVAAAAAAGPVVEKSVKKGKREAEAALEKSKSKKTKKDETVQKTFEKKKSELKTQKKKVESSSGSDESSEDEPIVAPAKKVPASAAKNGSVPANKAKDDSSSDSESSDSDSEEEPKVSIPAAKNRSVAEPEESGDSSDDDSSEEKEASKKTTASESDGSSDEVSDESDDSDEEGEDEPAKTPKKAGNDVKMADADKKAPKTPSTPQATGSKTLFAGNLSFQIEEANLREFFESAGEVVSVRFANDQDGRFRGFGHVEFATEAAAQKALKLNQKELLGRPIKLDLALERGANTPANGKDSSSQKGPTVFVKGLDTSLGEDELRGVLEEHFGKCGEITRISIPKDFESGGPKGFAYIDFKDNEAAQKALELDQSEVGGFSLTVDEAKPRADGGGSGRGGGRFGSGGRGGGRFGSGGRDSGGRFGRGGRRGGGRGGRDDGGRSGGRGRGGFNKPNFAGKKTKFDD